MIRIVAGLGLAAIGALAASVSLASPSQEVDGPYYEVSVHGVPFICDSVRKQRVPIFLTPTSRGGEAHIDRKGNVAILLNPAILGAVDARAALFAAYHECAHVALPIGLGFVSEEAETNADCFAIRKMVNHGFIRNGKDFESAVSIIANTRGSAFGHPPGPQRRRDMVNCLS